MEDTTYFMKCRKLERQLETVTRALHDAQEALDTERAMRKIERQQHQQRVDELLDEQDKLEGLLFDSEGAADA